MTERPRAGGVAGATSVDVASTVESTVVTGDVVSDGVVAGTGASVVGTSPATGVDVVTGSVSVTTAGAGAGAAATVGGVEGLGALGAEVVTAGLGDGEDERFDEEEDRADVVTGFRFTGGRFARGFMTSRGRLVVEAEARVVAGLALMPPRCSRSAASRVTNSRDSPAG